MYTLCNLYLINIPVIAQVRAYTIEMFPSSITLGAIYILMFTVSDHLIVFGKLDKYT